MKYDFFSSTKWVSLEIQAKQIAMLVVCPSKAKPIIEQALIINLAPHIFLDGSIKRFDLLSACLAEQVLNYQLKQLPAILTLPGNKVWFQSLLLPKAVSTKVIETQIFNHLAHELKQPNDVFAIDYAVAREIDAKQVEWNVVATQKLYLTDMRDCLNAAGLRLKVVDVDRYCLARLLRQEKMLCACLHLAQEIVTFIVVKNNELIFHKQWAISLAAGSFQAQIEREQKLCYALLNVKAIKKWYLLFDRDDYKKELLNSDIFKEIALCDLPLQELFNFSSHVNQTDFAQHAVEFACICGAIKREMPKW